MERPADLPPSSFISEGSAELQAPERTPKNISKVDLGLTESPRVDYKVHTAMQKAIKWYGREHFRLTDLMRFIQ